MLEDTIKLYLKLMEEGNVKEAEEVKEELINSRFDEDDFERHVGIVKRGIVERKDCWERLDDKAMKLMDEDDLDKFHECKVYCQSHIRIWLPEDVEELIREEKYEEAYKLLCSKYPDTTVQRVKNDAVNNFDELLLNSQDEYCIRKGPEAMMDYFISKKMSRNTMAEDSMTNGELGRIYRKTKAGL